MDSSIKEKDQNISTAVNERMLLRDAETASLARAVAVDSLVAFAELGGERT